MSKDMYERKQAYAENRMRSNAENENLTESQHNTLAWLCSIRHNVHVNQEAFFYDESSSNTEYWNLIDDGNGNGTISEKLAEVNLPDLEWSFSVDDYLSDTICKEYGYTDEETEEELKNVLEMAAIFNKDIEKYLRNIDKQYGTNYCPSGITRL